MTKKMFTLKEMNEAINIVGETTRRIAEGNKHDVPSSLVEALKPYANLGNTFARENLKILESRLSNEDLFEQSKIRNNSFKLIKKYTKEDIKSNSENYSVLEIYPYISHALYVGLKNANNYSKSELLINNFLSNIENGSKMLFEKTKKISKSINNVSRINGPDRFEGLNEIEKYADNLIRERPH